MSDTVVRALTQDGAFRVIAAITTETVRGAVSAQAAGAEIAASFGELITGAVLIREAMAPRLRVQAILKGRTGGNMVADAQPDGRSRGLLSFGAGQGSAADRPDPALLQVMRTLPSGAIHQGVVAVPEEGGVSGALMVYMAESEQVTSTIVVTTVLRDGAIAAAGGYMVQLLPEVERGPLMIMTERLAALPNLGDVLLDPATTPDSLVSELLYGMPFTRTEESPLSFGCNCSHTRLLQSLASLPRGDIEDLVRGGEVLEINCDYCRKEYRIAPAQLTALLLPS